MEKHFQLVYLLDLYGGLLTEKQYNILNQYYNEDHTISEIAEAENVSRQAAFDLLRRAEKLLFDYDSKLNLFDKYLVNQGLLDQIKILCKNEDQEQLQKLLASLENNL